MYRTLFFQLLHLSTFCSFVLVIILSATIFKPRGCLFLFHACLFPPIPALEPGIA